MVGDSNTKKNLTLAKSLRPNAKACREALPDGTDLRHVVRDRGARFLTCNAESRTRPRLEQAIAAGIEPTALLTRVRYTDERWTRWLHEQRLERL